MGLESHSIQPQQFAATLLLEEPVSSHQRRKAEHIESARMPSVSEIYELFYQLGDRVEAVCAIRLSRPRFQAKDVTGWIRQLRTFSGLSGVQFAIVSHELVVADKYIDARVHVPRLTQGGGDHDGLNSTHAA